MAAKKISTAQRMLFKREGVSQQSGSYPIPNREFLRRAIAAVGRSSTPNATKAHIISRAHALHAEDMLPENWPGSKKGAAKRVAAGRGM